jgi:hypothetical protein
LPTNSRVCARSAEASSRTPIDGCFNVTGDWDGAEGATLGERVIHSAAELIDSSLRPAECCQPPLFRR